MSLPRGDSVFLVIVGEGGSDSSHLGGTGSRELRSELGHG